MNIAFDIIIHDQRPKDLENVVQPELFQAFFWSGGLSATLNLENNFKIQTSWERSLWGNEEVNESTYNDREWHNQAVPQAMHNNNLRVYCRCKEVINMISRKEDAVVTSLLSDTHQKWKEAL